MKKLIAAVGVLAMAHAVSGQAQRPNFSGTWTLVADRSGAGYRPLGREITISQSSTTVTMGTIFAFSIGKAPAPGEAPVYKHHEIPSSMEYICDGAEHQNLPTISSAASTPGVVIGQKPAVTYRATWLNGQLVILRMYGDNNVLADVDRTALSLDSDGSLVTDSIALSMNPKENGPKQAPPVSVRSVYRRVQ